MTNDTKTCCEKCKQIFRTPMGSEQGFYCGKNEDCPCHTKSPKESNKIGEDPLRYASGGEGETRTDGTNPKPSLSKEELRVGCHKCHKPAHKSISSRDGNVAVVQDLCKKHYEEYQNKPLLSMDWEKEFDKEFIEIPDRLKDNKMAMNFQPTLKTYALEIKQFMKSKLQQKEDEILDMCEGMRFKCDGEFGCGYDGTQENLQHLCGSPPFAHFDVDRLNKVLEDLKNKIR